MPVHDASLREIVGRNLNVDSISGKNSDAMTAHSSRDMREDDMTVGKFHRERRARKNLFDAAGDFDGTLLDNIGGRVRFRCTPTLFSNSLTNGYVKYSIRSLGNFAGEAYPLTESAPTATFSVLACERMFANR